MPRTTPTHPDSSVSLRVIAPATPEENMDPVELPSAYSRSCNPPRRAKRSRTDSLVQSPASSSNPVQHRILPKPVQVEIDPDFEPDDSPAPTPASKRRGRKPGTLSRSARESLRKQNHSRIEKARRTKINDALATLRELVPNDYKPGDWDADEDDDGAGKKEFSKKDDKQKEFKLEVLVRTVAYMQDLIKRVEGGCANCGAGNMVLRRPPTVQAGTKRKRAVEEDEGDPDSDEDQIVSSLGDDEGMVQRATDNLRSQADERRNELSATAENTVIYSPTLLPSISSWLPKPYVDPSYIALSTSISTSPRILPQSHSRSTTHRMSPSLQLPSPPLSTQFRPSISLSTHVPPTLALPSPHPSPNPFIPLSVSPVVHSLRRVSLSARDKDVSLPQAWTTEDESAASMLLQISSSSPSSSSSASPPLLSRQPSGVEIQTPGSLLGLETSRVR